MNKMLENKELIIFDLDGTLIDSMNIWNEVDVLLVERLCGQKIKSEDLKTVRDETMFNTNPGEDKYLKYFTLIGKKFGSTLSAEEISKLNDEVAMDLLIHKIDYRNNADTFIKYLKDNNYKMVIATTSPKYMVDVYRMKNNNIISKANMDDYFDKIYTKESVENMKPSPEVYLKILNDYKIDPQKCLVFEDSIEGTKSAFDAGIEVVSIYEENSDNYRDLINELASYTINDYSEVYELKR